MYGRYLGLLQGWYLGLKIKVVFKIRCKELHLELDV